MAQSIILSFEIDVSAVEIVLPILDALRPRMPIVATRIRKVINPILIRIWIDLRFFVSRVVMIIFLSLK